MRHELKYIISPVQYHLLKGRLSPFLQLDKNVGPDGNYFIRSIYFDSKQYRALNEKNEGIDSRKKYRIRFYNGNSENCFLECKHKKGTRISKTSTRININEIEELMTGAVRLDETERADVMSELRFLIKKEAFHPVVVVDYLREAYIHPLSNLRITFDKEIGAGDIKDCFSKRRCLANALPQDHMILEVKYDEYLPDYIGQMIASIRPVQVAASKYVMCMTEKMEGRIL